MCAVAFVEQRDTDGIIVEDDCNTLKISLFQIG